MSLQELHEFIVYLKKTSPNPKIRKFALDFRGILSERTFTFAEICQISETYFEVDEGCLSRVFAEEHELFLFPLIRYTHPLYDEDLTGTRASERILKAVELVDIKKKYLEFLEFKKNRTEGIKKAFRPEYTLEEI